MADAQPPMSHPTDAAQLAACAHSRVCHSTEDAGERFVDATEQSPGGFHHTVRDAWKCDDCGTRFVPASEVTRAVQQGRAEERRRIGEEVATSENPIIASVGRAIKKGWYVGREAQSTA